MTENVVFWKWLGPRTLALVTEPKGDSSGAVYHWNLEGGQPPAVVFQRFEKLKEATTQIIGYATNSQNSWCLLTGIFSADGGKTISGAMQLYSVERQQQQMLEGHAGCFGDVMVQDGMTEPAGLFAFMERTAADPNTTKLRVMDVSKKATEWKNVAVPVQVPAEAPGDFAISLVISESKGVIFKATKAGFLYMFHCATGTTLFRYRVSQDAIFIGAPATRTGGMMLVNRKGLVMSACVNDQTIVNYVMTNLPHEPNASEIAFSLARRHGLPGAENLFNQQFATYFAAGDYKNAAKIAAQSKSSTLRSPETMAKFQAVSQQALMAYFQSCLECGKLSAYESVELTKMMVMQ